MDEGRKEGGAGRNKKKRKPEEQLNDKKNFSPMYLLAVELEFLCSGGGDEKNSFRLKKN